MAGKASLTEEGGFQGRIDEVKKPRSLFKPGDTADGNFMVALNAGTGGWEPRLKKLLRRGGLGLVHRGRLRGTETGIGFETGNAPVRKSAKPGLASGRGVHDEVE